MDMFYFKKIMEESDLRKKEETGEKEESFKSLKESIEMDLEILNEECDILEEIISTRKSSIKGLNEKILEFAEDSNSIQIKLEEVTDTYSLVENFMMKINEMVSEGNDLESVNDTASTDDEENDSFLENLDTLKEIVIETSNTNSELQRNLKRNKYEILAIINDIEGLKNTIERLECVYRKIKEIIEELEEILEEIEEKEKDYDECYENYNELEEKISTFETIVNDSIRDSIRNPKKIKRKLEKLE